MGFNPPQQAVLRDYDNGSHAYLLGCESLDQATHKVDPVVRTLLRLLEDQSAYSKSSICLQAFFRPCTEVDAAVLVLEALDLEISSRRHLVGAVHAKHPFSTPN
jgi:hypothetical protein